MRRSVEIIAFAALYGKKNDIHQLRPQGLHLAIANMSIESDKTAWRCRAAEIVVRMPSAHGNQWKGQKNGVRGQLMGMKSRRRGMQLECWG
jgi:hypothetical protein